MCPIKNVNINREINLVAFSMRLLVFKFLCAVQCGKIGPQDVTGAPGSIVIVMKYTGHIIT